MKKLLFLICILNWSLNTNAQCDSTLPVSENFSNPTSVNACWDFIDADGDGHNWYVADINGNNGLISESFTFATGALTPDNWAITYAIDLTSFTASSNILLTWKVRASSWSFDKERYTVYAATGNNISDFTSSSVNVFDNLDNSDASGAWGNRSLNLSSLAGKIIYLAFRHHLSAGQRELEIDDMQISAGSSGGGGGCTDSDGDGVCDIIDQCPGTPSYTTVDASGCPITNGCQESTVDFNGGTLSGSNYAILNFPSNSQDAKFSISGIDQRLKGNASNQYNEVVDVLYDTDGSGYKKYGTYYGKTQNTASINILGTIKSIKVILSDQLGGSSSNMKIDFSTVTYCSNSTPCTDDDNDGVCNADDKCPGTPANTVVDATGCPITSGCQETTSSFNGGTLNGSNIATINLPDYSQDVSFTISGLDEKLKGKPNNQYIELVDISYVDGNGASTLFATYSGTNVSSASITINGKVKSVTVSLFDDLNGNANSNMSINLSNITYCISSSNSTARISSGKDSSQFDVNMLSTSTFKNTLEESIKIFPNPTSSDLYVKSILYIDSVAYLYNINGLQVRSFNLSKLNNETRKLDIKGLSSGLYILRIIDKSGSDLKTEKIIIN